jgi:RNA polymerase sigma factor (sigma-70 family)
MSRGTLEKRFHELLSANGAALMRLAASYTNSSSDRDDLFQDIAMGIWKALPGFRSESSIRTFIFRIAQNRAVTYLAQRRPFGNLDQGFDLPDPRPNPEKEFVRIQQEARLLGAIRRLPVEYLQVITLTLEDMSYADIAEVLGISENNVGVRLSRARQILRQLVEAQK